MDANSDKASLGPAADEQLGRLVELRHRLADERATAVTPAVARALELADIQLFLAMTYVGHSLELFPEQS